MLSKRNPVLYFAVGDSSERHATIWRAWAATAKSDLYLGPRFAAHYSKLSVHGSGVRHLRRSGPNVRMRQLDGTWVAEGEGELRWKEGHRTGPGWEIAWRVLTPSGDLTEARLDSRFKSRVLWLAPGAAGSAVEVLLVLSFGLIFEQGDWPLRDELGGRCLARWRLANGETCFIISHALELSSEQEQWLATERATATRPVEWLQAGAGARFEHRMLIVLHKPEAQFRGVVDLALGE